MRPTLLLTVCLALAAVFILARPVHSASPTTRTPVLVELFTSEGCSSCPPADALLAHLLHDQPIDSAEIIVLGEHVDYWDSLGWHDRFSSPQFTARQSVYSTRFHLDGVYTPQMVVDGTAQFVGNDSGQARRSIAEATRAAKLPLALSPVKLDGRTFSATISVPAASGVASNQSAELYAALIDPADTTDVRNGENGGRTLHHVAVVRTLARIGTAADLAHSPLSFSIKAPDTASPDTMQLIVFAQQPNAGAILGIASSAK